MFLYNRWGEHEFKHCQVGCSSDCHLNTHDRTFSFISALAAAFYLMELQLKKSWEINQLNCDWKNIKHMHLDLTPTDINSVQFLLLVSFIFILMTLWSKVSLQSSEEDFKFYKYIRTFVNKWNKWKNENMKKVKEFMPAIIYFLKHRK